MPLPKRAPKPTPTFAMNLGSAAGTSIRDFYVLAHSPEYDDAFEHTNPITFESPTSRFTHVFHYTNGRRDQIHRVSDRLLALWQSPSGETLSAGFPRGMFDIAPAGVSETIFKGHDGVFTGIWGSSSAHVFACGMGPFALQRIQGKWGPIALPSTAAGTLHAIFGFAEEDVYFVGEKGTILHYDGQTFVELDVSTTRHLRHVGPLGRNLCVGGEDGVLLYGSVNGWRQVPTRTNGIIEGIAAWNGAIFFGTADGVWRFDGSSSPTIALQRPAQRVQSLGDGLLIKLGYEAHLWDGATLAPLDTIL